MTRNCYFGGCFILLFQRLVRLIFKLSDRLQPGFNLAIRFFLGLETARGCLLLVFASFTARDKNIK